MKEELIRCYSSLTDFITDDTDNYVLKGIIDFSIENTGTLGCTIFKGRRLEPGTATQLPDVYVDNEPNGGGYRVGGMKVKFDSGAGDKELTLSLHVNEGSKPLSQCN